MVAGWDVVEHLGAHQANLVPPDRPATAALLALPTPAIVRALLGDGAARLREHWIERWAERLGGGDGPLPTVDLDSDRRSLGRILRGLADGGCVRLWVIGARDQAGFARELVCRWPGELQLDVGAQAPELQPELAAALYDDPAPTRRLAVAPHRLLVAVDDDADPEAVVAAFAHESDEVLAYARDRTRVAGAGHGFLPPAALYATAAGSRLRDAWRRYWSKRGFGDAVREAALGLDPDLERRLAEPAEATAPPPRRARLIAITGLDGAGKSTHAAAVRDALAAAHRRVCVLKLYRQGAFLGLADELGARTRRGGPLASFRVSRVVKMVDSLRVWRDQLRPALRGCDAIILDRYVETHRAAAGAQLGWDLTRHPTLALFPPADRVFWLRLDADEALGRLGVRAAGRSADEHEVGLRGYAAAFAGLATSPADIVLDATAPFAANAARIASESLALTSSSPVAGAEPAIAATSPGAVLVARSEPLVVDVGGDAGPLGLGAEIPTLAALVRAELGGAADGVPASFWIEAYAAQLVLDARATGAAVASVPLWPGALRRMAPFAELVVLDELTRLLDAVVRVRRWLLTSAAADALWAAIAPSPAARRRLAVAYADALADVVRERGGEREQPSHAQARVA